MKTPENVPDNNVGRKTPEDIKKGLERCGGIDGDCENCPYDDRTIYCSDRMQRDALAYIQQLEDAIDKTINLQSSKKALCGNENVSWVEVLEAADQQKSRLAQAERERDAAVEELGQIRYCSSCKHYELSGGDEPCCYCDPLKKPQWQWRGVPENTKEDENE